MNKKLLMVTIPIIAVIIAAIGVLSYMLLATPTSEGLYLENIKTAQRYLDSGDVDNAILFYKSAIDADDTREEAYISLAKIYYERKHDLKNALDVLFQGYGKTGTVSIKSLLDYYVSLSEKQQGGDNSEYEDVAKYKGVINSSYMDIFSTYTYDSYKSHFTVKSEQSSGGTYTVSYMQFEAEFEYKNTPEQPDIVNVKSGKPISGARPTSIRVTDLSILIAGVDQGITTADLTARGAQDLMIKKPDALVSTYYASFNYRGCAFMVECDETGHITKTDGFNSIIPPVGVAEAKASTLTGSVLNADDNTPVKNATLNFRVGKNVRTGNAAYTLTTQTGEYSIELEAGDYTVEAIASGFITEFYDVYIPEGGVEINQSFVMSPVLKGNQMRFVVEWTNTQYDLYIHVKGNTSSGESLQFWEYGSSSGNVSQNIGDIKAGSQDGKRFTSATIMDSKGHYEFHVHGGKDQYTKQDLFNANVVVKIYKDNNSDPQVVNLPSFFPLSYWVVCSVHNGEIQLID